MIITLYDVDVSMGLAVALSAAAPAPPLPVFAERTVVATGGSWQPRGWDVDLSRPVTPVAALGLRTAPGEPAPSSHAWARIARTAAHCTDWQHRDWVAVRTSAESMLVLAATRQRPDPARLRAATEAIVGWQSFTDRRQPWTVHPDAAVPPVAEPLRILDARFDRRQWLTVLVPQVPLLDQLRFTPYGLPPNPHHRARHPGPDTLYVANHPGGYVRFLLDTGDGQGSNGEPVDLHLIDGTTRVVVGAWSSSHEAVARYAPALDIHPEDVVLHDDAGDFHAGRNGSGGHLTRDAAHHALRLAADHQRHPTALARVFHPPGRPAATSAIPPATGHPTFPPPPGHVRRTR